MRDSDWSRENLLRSDWLVLQGATITTHVVPTAIAKISSCRVYANSRRGIVQLGSTFGSIFLLFFL